MIWTQKLAFDSASCLHRPSITFCVASKSPQPAVFLWNTKQRHWQHEVDCLVESDDTLFPDVVSSEDMQRTFRLCAHRLHRQNRSGVLRKYHCIFVAAEHLHVHEKMCLVQREENCAEPQMWNSPSQSNCRVTSLHTTVFAFFQE